MSNGRLENEKKINKYIESILKEYPDYVKEWNSYLAANGRTAHTRETFIYQVGYFLSFVGNGNPNVNLSMITKSKVRDYFIDLQTITSSCGIEKESSLSYKRLAYSSLNNFFKFLKSDGYIKENYIDDIAYPKGSDLERIKSNKNYLTEEDFLNILNQAKNEENDLYRYRNTCILAILMTTGMRKSALLSINMDDINIEKGTITVVDKGNKFFEYPLADNVLEILEEWIAFRKDYLNGEDVPALFISSSKERMFSIDYTVQKYTKEALGKALSPHKIRAGFATILYKNNPDLIFVQKAMGHSHSSTTERYIKTDNTERAAAANFIGSIL